MQKHPWTLDQTTERIQHMDIYNNNYRKIWIEHNGPIPIDENGRSYEIHHIDGNHSNNHIDNLKCVSIQEHYDMHYNQGDYGSCYLIYRRMKFTHSELSELAKKINAKLVAEKRHPFQLHRRSSEEQAEIARKVSKRLLAEGNHPFTKEENRKKAVENTTITQNKMVEEGTHHFLSGEVQRKNALS